MALGVRCRLRGRKDMTIIDFLARALFASRIFNCMCRTPNMYLFCGSIDL